ncbi:alginate export family protein [Sphingomicrobium nitratireducens]|uniref:alginate export family protein n=1 Tax=Sphingomicrobium nitratireducens TaxID=2964666 RepID=UPI002240DF1E
MTKLMTGVAMVAISIMGAASAVAQDTSGEFTIDPMTEVRLRYENVDQPTSEADALTLRLRAGATVSNGTFTLLAEGEGTIGLTQDYNAFPFPIDDEQRRTGYSVVADPEGIELNRLQLSWAKDGNEVTIGRQRINLDDQRWVGSVGWRQSEQTFDAVRGQFGVGKVKADLTYSNSQRTIFGSEAGPRTAYDGDFLFGGVSSDLGKVQAKAFTYLLDYDEDFFLANSSQTYGLLVNGSVPLGGKSTLKLKASYARQSDYGDSPLDYAADYWAFEAGTGFSIVNMTLGYEQLGSDNGTAVRTPMATLHKFNGWADMFLNTPADGLQDRYAGVGFDLGKVAKTMNAQIVYHQFDSDVGSIDFGYEWDASIGVKAGDIGLLAKFARYRADAFAVDTDKIWLQAEYKF